MVKPFLKASRASLDGYANASALVSLTGVTWAVLLAAVRTALAARPVRSVTSLEVEVVAAAGAERARRARAAHVATCATCALNLDSPRIFVLPEWEKGPVKTRAPVALWWSTPNNERP
jgi:hypothetical protein